MKRKESVEYCLLRQTLTLGLLLLYIIILGCSEELIVGSDEPEIEVFYGNCMDCHKPNDYGWGHVEREDKE